MEHQTIAGRGIGALVVLVLSVAAASLPAYAKDTRAQFLAAIAGWNDPVAKEIALLLAANHPEQTRLDDEHGYAPQWRNNKTMSAMGICAHRDKKSGRWFLESQFPKSQQRSSGKYISWGDGTWYGRTHKYIKLPGGKKLFEQERNWPANPVFHRSGKDLAVKVLAEMKAGL